MTDVEGKWLSTIGGAQTPGTNWWMFPPSKVIRLRNVTCPYCGGDVRDERTKEHVIARRFVPKGMLNCEWNLILWACDACNRKKARLEDHVSAITLQPDVLGRYADEDEHFVKESVRKGKGSVSLRTGKPVRESRERLTIGCELAPGWNLTVNFTAPPQPDSDSVNQLALMHVKAFFYLTTYRPAEQAGRFWRGQFLIVGKAMRSDWGNVMMRGFMDAVAGWDPRFVGVGAGECFKIAIRKHPSALSWSWALEWNRNMRVIGFCGDKEAGLAMAKQLPRPEMHSVVESPERTTRFHFETRLASTDNRLFNAPEFEVSPFLTAL